MLVYRKAFEGLQKPEMGSEEIRIWRPRLSSWLPSGKGKKYAAYSAFHWLGAFGNADYCSITLMEADAASSMLCVPPYFRWPFMAANDIQFAYVLTSPEARGRGLASRLLAHGIELLGEPGRSFWYVTSMDNVASQALATRCGFKFFGYGLRQGRFIRRLVITDVAD